MEPVLIAKTSENESIYRSYDQPFGFDGEFVNTDGARIPIDLRNYLFIRQDIIKIEDTDRQKAIWKKLIGSNAK
jgi:hypothetical protein